MIVIKMPNMVPNLLVVIGLVIGATKTARFAKQKDFIAESGDKTLLCRVAKNSTKGEENLRIINMAVMSFHFEMKPTEEECEITERSFPFHAVNL